MQTYDPLTAERYGEFVEYAVEMYYSDPTNLTPAPPSGFSDTGFEIVAYVNAIDRFVDETEMKFFGFVARSTSQPAQIVIAVRGTEASLEWLIDLEIWPTEFTPIPAAGYVEYGFFSIFTTMIFVTAPNQPIALDDLLKTLVSDSADPSITIVGHSLGGALATMLTLVVLDNDPSLVPYTTLYTLASPALGDGTFADYFDATVQTSFRVWNEFDLVPRALVFYTHVSGAGDEIIQTLEQIESIEFTPLCEHELTTYLWLLNPNNQFSGKFQAACETGNMAAAAGRRMVRARSTY